MSGRTQGYCFFGACRQAAGGELCPEDLFAFWKPFEALQAPRTMTFSKRPARPELIFSPRCHAQRSRSLGAHGVFFLQPQSCQGGGSGSTEIPPDSPLTLVLDQKSQPLLRFSISTSRSTDTTRISWKPATCRRHGRSFGVQILCTGLSSYRATIDVGVRTSPMPLTNACSPHQF